MKTLLASVALGLALSSAPAFAGPQSTGQQIDDALSWAAVGGRGAVHGARAEYVKHRRYRGAYDMVGSPSGFGGVDFPYGADLAPYPSGGGSPLDFQLQGK